jgi:branched-subunit amino acid transport protein
MTGIWGVVAAIGIGTMAIKAAGPVLLGGRPLPRRVQAVVAMLAPALLAALVATATFGSGQQLVADARLIGVAVAVGALLLRAPILVVVVLAAAGAAIARLTGLT